MHSKNIQLFKDKFGSNLAILAHHYQSDAIVEHADLVGDSLQLAAAIPELEAEYIVFCGVDFMAETAAVLAGPRQKIFSPDLGATCVMADMAPDYLVNNILQKLNHHQRVIPLAYVNSSIGVKALCGEYGGSVCTSSNASKMLTWALTQGDQVLFLPDQNLGRNVSARCNIPDSMTQTIDIRKKGSNINPANLASKKILFWPGVCAVHFRLKAGNVMEIMHKSPEALIVVHPESHPHVVDMAHASGSTSKIISFVEQAVPGSTIYIGTEDNLVLRLKQKHPDKNILPLGAGYCSNMAKITPELLSSCLENLSSDNAVQVNPSLISNANKAVETMLRVTAS
ncbi:quinolinate synthase NadA [Desulfonatronovibrio magnus]|uniref:quinolinate synthase NadA n=1 Tax=Desulfonatronovibrio magnus TaxID=698827 RepID=UPI0005EAEEA3|nr:quinolinate synthase NadA [Desulfonatronovibrio magnus]